jgi:hypothetical protein
VAQLEQWARDKKIQDEKSHIIDSFVPIIQAAQLLQVRKRTLRSSFFLFWGISNPLCLFSSSALHLFQLLFFLVHYPVNWDDRHLLAHALASDFTVSRQFSQREQLFFLLWIKLHALLHSSFHGPP